MAEIFGAVASGAGLASLAIQLVDSAQKLKALYNASKDAPTTVAELCFELETMSLSLRQLDSHRNASISGDELLGRCYITCIRMVGKIRDAVTKIERLIQRRRMVGRLYMAFKEPEIRELLEELERSKSSMLFAYMSYCHSWSLREAAKNVTLMTAQSNAISSQMIQLHDLEHTVQAGNTMILDRLPVPTSEKLLQNTSAPVAHRLEVEVRKSAKQHSHRKFRISLPRFLVDCVWEFGVRGTNSGWEFQLHPVNMRSRESIVFKVVRSGRVPAVRALLDFGSLSIHDHAVASEYEPCENLLDMAAGSGNIELCKFLLDQYSYFCEDATMHSALSRFVSDSYCRTDKDFTSIRQEADDMYDLFMKRHSLVLPNSDEEHHIIIHGQNVESNMLLTEKSLRQVLDGQFASTRSRTLEQKFPVAMRAVGWPADAFLGFLQPCDSTQLITKTDGQGRTALHWAAKHFGYWACAWSARDSCPDNSMVNSYAALLIKLILLGADVHAVNSQHETPLMTAMYQCLTFTGWPELALMMKLWGEILVEGGLVLSDYIHVENSMLQFQATECRARDGYSSYALFPNETQLLITEGSILAVEIRFCRLSSVWEHRPLPGAWDTESSLPIRSLIHPHWLGDNALYWHEVDKVKIYSASYLIRATPEVDKPFCSLEDLQDSWRSFFKGTQDDHGPVASMLLRDRSRSGVNVPVLRDRACSMPPELTHKVYDQLPTHLGSGVDVDLGGQHWIPIAYRDPIDLGRSWRPGTSYTIGFRAWANPRCSKSFESRSIEDRLRATDDWEVQLLREKNGVDAVKRFADRFCPKLRDQVVEEMLAASR